MSLCSSLTDSRGTVWTETLPGTIAVAPCPDGYTGIQMQKQLMVRQLKCCDQSLVYQMIDDRVNIG